MLPMAARRQVLQTQVELVKPRRLHQVMPPVQLAERVLVQERLGLLLPEEPSDPILHHQSQLPVKELVPTSTQPEREWPLRSRVHFHPKRQLGLEEEWERQGQPVWHWASLEQELTSLQPWRGC